MNSTPGIRRDRRAAWPWHGLILLLSAAVGGAAPKTTWRPVTPVELAETVPQIEPDAPAEVMFWTIEIDDRDFPASRRTTEYIRYKIFAPDKVASITRISQLAAAEGGVDMNRLELQARLTLPNGTVKEFGKDAIQERSVAKSAGEQSFLQRVFGGDDKETKEKFLAVSGVEAGAILEYMVSRTNDNLPRQAAHGRVLQMRDIPIRVVTFVGREPDSRDYEYRAFLVNSSVAKATLIHDDKKRTVTMTAEHVPALTTEPLAGPIYDYAMTVLTAYAPINVTFLARSHNSSRVTFDTKKDGPWSRPAALMAIFETDCTDLTQRVRRLAAQLTEGSGTPLERAQRIHRHVTGMYQSFLKLPKPTQPATVANRVQSLDDMLDYEKTAKNVPIQSIEFLFLEIGLMRAAGLDTRLVLLPNRSLTRFDQRMVSQAFLSDFGVAVLIDGTWHFCVPNSRVPTAIDGIPWNNQGQVALVAKEGQQEFLDVPFTPAAQSTIVSSGTFRLSPEGELSGQGGRRFTGQPAYVLKQRLRGQTEERQWELLKQRLEHDIKGAEVTIEKVTGVDNPDEPLDMTFQIRLPGCAVLTRDRLVLRPQIYRLQSASPFSAPTRRFPIQFDFPWQEIDEFSIELPPNYRFQSLTPPDPVEGSDRIYHGIRLEFDPEKHALKVRRKFVSAACRYSTAMYDNLKKWFDAIADADAQEYSFIKIAPDEPAPAPGGTSGTP
jgi:hypothetical protein